MSETYAISCAADSGRCQIRDPAPAAVATEPAGPQAAPALARELAHEFARSRSSDGTREAYDRDLTQFMHWCQLKGLDALAVESAHVLEYLTSPRHDGYEYASATRLRHHCSLSGYFDFVVGQGLRSANPVNAVDRSALRVERDATDHLSAADLRALLRAADDRGAREAAFVRLLIYNALRVTELVGLQRCDVHLDGPAPYAELVVRRRRTVTRRTIVLNDRTAEAVRRYLAERPHYRPGPDDVLEGEEDPGPLLLSSNGRPLHRQHLAALILTLCRHAQIPRVSPDGLRASSIALARRRGPSLVALLEAPRKVRVRRGEASRVAPSTAPGRPGARGTRPLRNR